MRPDLQTANLRLVILPESLAASIKRAGFKLEQVEDIDLLYTKLSGEDLAVLMAANTPAYHTCITGVANPFPTSLQAFTGQESALTAKASHAVQREVGAYSKVFASFARQVLYQLHGDGEVVSAPTADCFEVHVHRDGLVALVTKYTPCAAIDADTQKTQRIVTAKLLTALATYWPANIYVATALYYQHLKMLHNVTV